MILTITTSGTHGASSVSLDRTANVDIVSQEAGLLSVLQTTTESSTTGSGGDGSGSSASGGGRTTRGTSNTIDLTVTVTNQITVEIVQVDISLGGTTETIGSVASGATDSVIFIDIDCASLIMINYNTGSLERQIRTDILERQIRTDIRCV